MRYDSGWNGRRVGGTDERMPVERFGLEGFISVRGKIDTPPTLPSVFGYITRGNEHRQRSYTFWASTARLATAFS